MLLGEIFGYAASLLVFATFYMKSMMPLRIVAIASNIAFITYATIDGLTPILILHVALLPLNVLRLLQMHDFMRQVEHAARDDFSAQALVPLMQRRKIRANETLFTVNDAADELYYVVEGTLFLPDLHHDIGPGSFLGEFAIFSQSGRRTATVVARTDCVLMVLSRNAVFSALLQQPRLGVHLLKLITARLMQNAREDHPLSWTPAALPQPANDAARHPPGLFSSRTRRNAARLIAVAAFVAMIAIFQPLYAIRDHDGAVTAWVNVATAPISGTVDGFEAQPGRKVAGGGEVARIANLSADRGGVIAAAAVVKRAEARLEQLNAHGARVAALAAERQQRQGQYADAFSRDLDLKVQELESRVASLRARAATSGQREALATLGEAVKALEQVHYRRDQAARGIYLQQDGTEPEWASRSLDEIRLEEARTTHLLRQVEEELKSSRTMLEDEQKNLDTASTAALKVPPGMTIWSTSATNGLSVRRGERLFTWIDCSRLLVDVPVNETLAALVENGGRAEVTLEGEHHAHNATVILSRGASSRLTKAELVSVPNWNKSDAQVIVALDDAASIADCPVGRRAHVFFPGVGLVRYISAMLPRLR